MKNLIRVTLLLISINCFSAERAQPKEPQQLFTQEEYQVYCAARELVSLFTQVKREFNEQPERGMTYEGLQEATADGLLPAACRVLGGLVLEFSNGTPSCLYTPWGRWAPKTHHLAYKKQSATDAIRAFWRAQLEEKGVELREIEFEKRLLKNFDSSYLIKTVGKRLLPDLATRTNYMNRHPERDLAFQNTWRAMTEKYEAEKPNAVSS